MTITILCIICIGIEVFNALLYKQTSKTSLQMKKWLNTIKMNQAFDKGLELYSKNYSDNTQILSLIHSKDELGRLKQVVKDPLLDKAFNKKTTKTLYINCIKTVGRGKVILYTFYQVINLVYLGMAFALAFLLPFPAGAILFILLMGLSVAEYLIINNKEITVPYFRLIDSFVCICMFLMVLFVF